MRDLGDHMGIGRERLYGLDALRGIAALIITLVHLFHRYHLPDHPLHRGLFVVDFFFMLSGSVMARTYERRFADNLGPARFMALRYVRLWPVMSIGVILGSAIYLFSGAGPWQSLAVLALGLLMLPHPGMGWQFPANVPQWSIAFELVANFVHAAFLWKLDARRLVIVAAICAAFVLSSSRGLDISPPRSFLLCIPRALLPYTIGIIIWRVTGGKSSWPFWPAPVLLALSPWLFTQLLGSSYLRADILFVIVIAPAIMLAGLGFNNEGRWAPAAAISGAISYPLYAVHFPVIVLAMACGAPMWLSFALALAVAVFVTMLLDRRGIFPGAVAQRMVGERGRA